MSSGPKRVKLWNPCLDDDKPKPKPKPQPTTTNLYPGSLLLPGIYPAPSWNPIVAAVMGFPNQTINQNCCATCGAAFRLTSDLVQHMRSHHRRPGEGDGRDAVRSGRRRRAIEDLEGVQCMVCLKECGSKEKLAVHLQTHQEKNKKE